PVKKVGFRIDIDRLAILRTERVKRLPGADAISYSSRSYIIREQDYCESIYRKMQSLWTIDVTNRSIEETSEWITREVL
ncbi:MAG: kinase/pyrophosphorylase, partial [Pseudomonadota bacterium]